MGTQTTYLKLAQPANGEYPDTWDTVINNNVELIDDWALDLRTHLVGSSDFFTALHGGSGATLASRLLARLNLDGSLKLESEPKFTTLAYSKKSVLSTATAADVQVLQRLDKPEEDLLEINGGEKEGRIYNADNPWELYSASAGISRMLARYSAYDSTIGDALQSPIRGFTPNSFVGNVLGTEPCFSTTTTKVKIANGTIFNIDGFLFHVKGNLEIDIAQHITDGDITDNTYYLMASRHGGKYNTASSATVYYAKIFGQALASSLKLNERIVPATTGLRKHATAPQVYSTTGATSAGTVLFSDVSAGTAFDTYGVDSGDILVITHPQSIAGRYLIDDLDAITPATALKLISKIRTTVAAVTYYITKPLQPAFYWSTSNATYEGSICVGKFVVSGGAITPASTVEYAPNGIWDSGWQNMSGLITTHSHTLGTLPSQVDIFVSDAGGTTSEPQILMKVAQVQPAAGAPAMADVIMAFPALKYNADVSTIQVGTNNFNYITDDIIYHNISGTAIEKNTALAKYRIIARR